MFTVVVDAIDRRALSEGGRLETNDGCGFGCCCSGGGCFRGAIDAKIQNSKKKFFEKSIYPILQD